MGKKSKCLIAIDSITKEIQKNKKELSDFERDLRIWKPKQEKWGQWEAIQANVWGAGANHNEFEQKIHSKWKELDAERKETNDYGGPNRRNETHCQNQAKKHWNNEGWEYGREHKYRKKQWSDHAKLMCQRSTDGINRMLADLKTQIKPENPGPEPQRPTSVITNSAVCCEQVFSDIKVTGGDLDLNAIQNCSSRLKTGSGTEEGTNVISEEDEEDEDEDEEDEDEDNILYWISGGGAGIFFSSSSSCCLFIIIMLILFM
jgi:hypothetical protein